MLGVVILRAVPVAQLDQPVVVGQAGAGSSQTPGAEEQRECGRRGGADVQRKQEHRSPVSYLAGPRPLRTGAHFDRAAHVDQVGVFAVGQVVETAVRFGERRQVKGEP